MKFSPSQLGELLQAHCPRIVFALLHGSAKDGLVEKSSDIDLALFIEGKPSWELYSRVMGLAEQLAPGVRCDVGILNDACLI